MKNEIKKKISNAQSVLNLIFESAVERDKITYKPLYKLGFRKLQFEKAKETAVINWLAIPRKYIPSVPIH